MSYDILQTCNRVMIFQQTVVTIELAVYRECLDCFKKYAKAIKKNLMGNPF